MTDRRHGKYPGTPDGEKNTLVVVGGDLVVTGGRVVATGEEREGKGRRGGDGALSLALGFSLWLSVSDSCY